MKNEMAIVFTKWYNMYEQSKPSEGSYGTAKKKRPGYLAGNLVATSWPIEKALHATKFQLNSPIG